MGITESKTKKLPRAHKRLTGGLQWYVSDYLVVQWWGEGCCLFIMSTQVNGLKPTAILFDGWARRFESYDDAKAGFAEFFNRSASALA